MTTHKEALTLALELLAVGTFHSPELQAKRTEVIEQGLNALAQPEQEPVAYLYHDANSIKELLESERKCLNMHSVLISIRRHEAYRNETPLYTTPPQRKPLTVDDSGWYWLSENECIHVDLIRKVEAAHGIKGDA